jgi:hypothetical protein
MTKLDKGRAMKCFGDLVERIELDPDPHAQDELQKEYNCANCDSKPFCDALADTLKDKP